MRSKPHLGTRTPLYHTFTTEQFQSIMFNFFWTVERNWRTCKLQIERARPKTLFLRGSCAAPAPPCCPTFKQCSLIFFCFSTNAISLVSLPPIFTTCTTTAHSISWNCDNSRLISVASYRARLLQTTLKQESFSDKPNRGC